MMIIYKATNKINGKVYIGQTTKGLKHRRKIHQWSNTNYPFHRAIGKYGRRSFIWETIEECYSKEEMDEMEFHYIKQYNSKVPNGYNLTDGGEGVVGNVISEETRRKMSIAAYNRAPRTFSDIHKKRISESRFGKDNPNYGKPMPSRVKSMLVRINKSMVGSKNPLSKKFVITTPMGDEFVVIGLNKFCKDYCDANLSRGNLSNCASGRYSQHKGYKCRYYDEDVDASIPFWEA